MSKAEAAKVCCRILGCRFRFAQSLSSFFLSYYLWRLLGLLNLPVCTTATVRQWYLSNQSHFFHTRIWTYHTCFHFRQNSSGAASDQSSDPSAINSYQRTSSDINSGIQADRSYTDMYRGIMPTQMGQYSYETGSLLISSFLISFQKQIKQLFISAAVYY